MSEVRLIDADALKRYIPTRMDMQDLYLPVHFKTLIDEQPTVDAVPVEWIESYVRDARATGDFSDDMCAVAIEAMLNDYRADGERGKGWH